MTKEHCPDCGREHDSPDVMMKRAVGAVGAFERWLDEHGGGVDETVAGITILIQRTAHRFGQTPTQLYAQLREPVGYLEQEISSIPPEHRQ